ncbi:hypothetical protein C8Q76DRAFT_313651 [Earliella scabrosa]|nr:hypothetical protein C8Q76DRAFT_313651 [Earliella scabrosa]
MTRLVYSSYSLSTAYCLLPTAALCPIVRVLSHACSLFIPFPLSVFTVSVSRTISDSRVLMLAPPIPTRYCIPTAIIRPSVCRRGAFLRTTPIAYIHRRHTYKHTYIGTHARRYVYTYSIFYLVHTTAAARVGGCIYPLLYRVSSQSWFRGLYSFFHSPH